MDEEDHHEEEVSAGDVGTVRSVPSCGEARNLFPTPGMLSYASIIPAYTSLSVHRWSFKHCYVDPRLGPMTRA